MKPCLLVSCPRLATVDVLCAKHAAHYRRPNLRPRCVRCARFISPTLVILGETECRDCEERERNEALLREIRLERRRARQRVAHKRRAKCE
jgi:hypothetical protein